METLEEYRGMYPVVQFFSWSHLPPEKAQFSKPFGELALHLCQTLPSNNETVKALDALLIAKDAAVRSSFSK